MRAAALVLLLAAGAGTASPGRSSTLFDYLDFNTASLFRVGASVPFGKVMSENFGTRYPVAFEGRVRSRFGVGAWASAGIWWLSRGGEVSTFVPLTLGGFYSHPFFRGILCPYAGVFLSHNLAQFYFPAGDSMVSAKGSGTTAGLALGAEIPLSRIACFVADVSLGFGRGSMEFAAPAAGMPAGRNSVTLSSFTASLGLTTGFGDLPIW
jgi:hypothetical protein